MITGTKKWVNWYLRSNLVPGNHFPYEFFGLRSWRSLKRIVVGWTHWTWKKQRLWHVARKLSSLKWSHSNLTSLVKSALQQKCVHQAIDSQEIQFCGSGSASADVQLSSVATPNSRLRNSKNLMCSLALRCSVITVYSRNPVVLLSLPTAGLDGNKNLAKFDWLMSDSLFCEKKRPNCLCQTTKLKRASKMTLPSLLFQNREDT